MGEKPARLTLAEFLRHLESEMELESGQLCPTTDLEADLSFDSLDRLELLLAVESVGVTLNDEFTAFFRTPQDLYGIYCWSLDEPEMPPLGATGIPFR
jgi:acyl carrier protein